MQSMLQSCFILMCFLPSRSAYRFLLQRQNIHFKLTVSLESLSFMSNQYLMSSLRSTFTIIHIYLHICIYGQIHVLYVLARTVKYERKEPLKLGVLGLSVKILNISPFDVGIELNNMLRARSCQDRTVSSGLGSERSGIC